MKIQSHFIGYKRINFLIFGFIFFGQSLFAQTQITDYVIFGVNGSTIGSTCNIQPGSKGKGAIGSFRLVKSTGNLTVNGNIYSGDSIQLANSNVVTGNLAAGSSISAVPRNVISIGSSATLSGNIDANGNIVIGGGTVSGIVTHPSGTTYSGPFIGDRNITGPPTLPGLPQMPDITTFPAAGTTDITTSFALPGPGGIYNYDSVGLNGNKTLTFNGPGVYVFNSIKNSGTSNDFVFDFQNNLTGKIKVYVYGNVDLGKVKASILRDGGTGASRIYFEIHGTATASNPVAFSIANGSAGSASKWVGTVWAPYAAINIGSGTGSTNFTGALLSGTQVNIQSGISMIFEPFLFCDNPVNAKAVNAGLDTLRLNFTRLTRLIGSSTSPGINSFSWRVINGGIIDSSSTNADTIYVSAAGTYILTVTSTSDSKCFARDTVVVTSRLKSIIGSELQSIYDNNVSSSPFFVIQPDSVMIDVIVNSPSNYNTVLNLLQTDVTLYGLTNVRSNGASSYIITGKFPINHLPNLNSLSALINYCRPYYEGLTNIITSAGDTSVRSWLVRKGYDVDGDGIKIGVISNSYNTITIPSTTPPITNTVAADIANNDLPGTGNPKGYTKPVHVLKDLSGLHSDEGRAMLQIVHDIAPGAELYFHTGSLSAGDFAKGIRDLRDSGCNIIVDDLTYITEPFLKDGVVANAVNDVTAPKVVNGVTTPGTTYFSAAGNFASKSYESRYDSVPAPSGFGTGKTAHNFGGGDIYDNVTLLPGNYTFVLQWVDSIHSIGQGGTKNDLDIYLTPNTDGTGLFGFNRDNINGDPIEFIHVTVYDTITSNILIVNNTTTSSPSWIKFIVFRGNIIFNEHLGESSTVVGQANALGAIAIGAAIYNRKDSVESFSSTGGTTINNVKRKKPELVGPDGVNTTVNMGGDYPDPLSGRDGYSNFFGTSAAAPHAAAMAALIMQGRKKFLAGNPSTSPDTIRSLLTSTATDMYSSINLPGTKFDYVSGYGFINADSAMRTFAAPRPSIDLLIVLPVTVPPIIPGESSFTLKIAGNNFSNNSVISYDTIRTGTTVHDTISLVTTFLAKDTVQAVMPVFRNNPAIRVYTPPYPTTIRVNGQPLDGGYSNSLYFFSPRVTVIADNKTKKYADSLPALTATILVDGVLLENTNPRLTLTDLGLSDMTLRVPDIAINPGNVGTYNISFSQTSPDNPALLEKYEYKFTEGTLTILKRLLTITAQDITVNYGDPIPNVTFTYDFDGTNITDSVALLGTIDSTHQSQLAKDTVGTNVYDIFGLVNGEAVTIENGEAVTIENGEAVTIENGEAVTIENGLPIVNFQALTIDTTSINGGVVNGVVIDTSGYNMDSLAIRILDMSFLATDSSLKNIRPIANRTGTTNVVDITEESILSFYENAAQTHMLNSVSNVDAKGLVDINSYENGEAVVIENGEAVTIENGEAVTIENGEAVIIENGEAVTIENGTLIIENGEAVVIDNATGEHIKYRSSNNRTAVIVDENEIGDGVTSKKSLNVLTGLSAGEHFIIPGTFSNNNFDRIYIPGKLTIVKGNLTVKANDTSRQYGSPNPELKVSYSGFVPGDNLQNSVAGVPSVSTTATQTSPVGTYPINVNIGTLESSNYTFFPLVNGTLTITDTCLLTRSPFNNFGSTPSPQKETSLWVNVAIKISGQLKTHGRYLFFAQGSITLKDIDAKEFLTNIPITTKNIPNGMIMADKNVIGASNIYTEFTSNTWITHVPVGFSSTSDIFITGAIINSNENGFKKVKTNANSSTVVKGSFFSDTTYSDQWTYALATYRPIFDYSAIAGNAPGIPPVTGKVISINGTYRAGTPVTLAGTPINFLVNGGSGGGGNNYTGSTSSFDNFKACKLTGSPPFTSRVSNSLVWQDETREIPLVREVQIIPNPASNYISLLFVPTNTGNYKTVLYTIDGRKVFEIDNGICEAGLQYLKKIDVSKLKNGVYVVQLRGKDKTTIKKIIISR